MDKHKMDLCFSNCDPKHARLRPIFIAALIAGRAKRGYFGRYEQGA